MSETNYKNMTEDAAETRPAVWYSKETAPMDGKWCWASDGKNIWIVIGHKDGTLRSDRASAVHYWTRDYIPEPPVSTPPAPASGLQTEEMK